MSDDLIKRDDALAAIAAFKRDFEQSWKVQFRANIYAIPEVKDDLIEELRLCRIADAITLIGEQRKLAKAVETLQKISRHANRSCSAIAARALAKLEGGE